MVCVNLEPSSFCVWLLYTIHLNFAVQGLKKKVPQGMKIEDLWKIEEYN